MPNKKNNLPSRMSRVTKIASVALLFLLQLVFSTPASAQTLSVTGKVLNEIGAPLEGASITQKGATTGTVTNKDGAFTINVPKGAIIVISATGYAEKEVTVSGTSQITVELEMDQKSLEEVVVVGYGTQRKIDVTGAVSRVNLESQVNAPNTNIGQFLQGTIPGLNVGVSTFAGGTPPINIRGRVTINGSQTTLIILDGIQYNGSLSSINPDDIASIDVLKDASSTAVYGAQAANGVILITSRKGKFNQKPRIAFSSAYTLQQPTVGDDMFPMNREQFLKGVAEAFYNESYIGPGFTQPNPAFNIIAKVDATMANPNRTALLPNDYDWFGEATGTGSIFENNLSFSGGGDKVNYLLSGGFVDQKGFIVNDKFKRTTLRANLEVKPFDWWKVGLVSSGSFVNQDGAEPSFGVINITSPLLVPYDSLGKVIPNPSNTVVPNPFNTFYVDDYDRVQYYFANVYSEIDVPFLKGLTYRLNFGNNARTNQRYTASQFEGNLTGRVSKRNETYYDYTLDNILTYKKSFDKHDITGTLLYGAIERKYSNSFVEGIGFSRLNLSYNELGNASVRNASSFSSREALNYQMARLNYNYDDKYLLTATVRRDGFSGFSKNNKSAIFPTAALGWIISSEKFMQNIQAVNFLKLRLGYGVSGNQTAAFSSLALVGVNSSYVFGNGGNTAFGQQVTSLGNDDLKWERTIGLNLGVDFTLFNNRLTGNLEYYDNNTFDLLFDVPLPTLTGFSLIRTNLGQINNKGFEAGLTYKVINSKNFSWTTSYNFWLNNNKVVKLTGIDANNDGKEDDVISTGTGGLYIGKPLNTIFDYQAGPIYGLTDTRLPGFQIGSLSVIDQNKDGVINAADRTFLGSLDPAYRMSLLNTFNYKRFTFSFFLNSILGTKDRYVGNNLREYFRDDNGIRNNDLRGIDYWSPANPGGKYPRVISGTQSTVRPPMYESRSFVRLQDVSLSYNLPANILQKIKAQAINFYVSGKNLLTITNWEGWDPETGQGMITDGRPVLRAVTFGLHITY